ncbi:MAG TPA: hypothetical protein VH583_22360 [Vicinamibacterales bacterium]|jgi:hypothetical protein
MVGRPDDSSPCCSYAYLADGPAGSAYGEETFRYLLGIERKRSERSSRPFFLLLVDLKRDDGSAALMEGEVAGNVFAGLSQALRETDFIGWYREGRVAGAVLAQHADSPDVRVALAVSQRVKDQICAHVPALAERVQTRIFQLPRTTRE